MARAAEVLALTLYAEAGTRPVRAIEALAALVVNRARAAPLRRLPAGDGACVEPAIHSPAFSQTDPRLAICRRIAARAASGALVDPTGGATHWHTAEELPPWALGQVPEAEIGGLVFYRLGA